MRTADLLELAVEVAGEAGSLLRSLANRRDLAVAAKTSATDPVSEADTASERLIAKRLLAARPDDGILAEEDERNRPGTSGLRWVVDPLDGTVNYLYGIPQWCVSVACEDADGALVGVVHDPSRNETFAAERGGRTTLDGAPTAVTEVATLGDTLLATGFAYDPAMRADQGRLVADLLPRVRDIRRPGSAALDLAWVAAGRFDAYLEFGLSPWDWSAGQLLVAAAGGVTSWHERTLGGAPRRGLVAAGPTAHAALAEWLTTVT